MVEPADSTISREAILAHLDGADLPEVAAALQASPWSAALAAEYAALQGRLVQSLYRHDCPPTQSLGDYALQLLPTAERVALATHVNACPHCATELAQIRTFLAVEADAPPLGLAERGRRLFVALAALPAPIPHAALRGIGAGGGQTYQVEDIAITLDPLASAPHGRGTLTGLIVRERDDSLADAPVTLTSPDGTAQTTTIDEIGNFVFEEIAAGDYQLEVRIGDDTIVIRDLHIGR